MQCSLEALHGFYSGYKGDSETTIPPGYDEDWPARLDVAQDAGVDAAVTELTVETLPYMPGTPTKRFDRDRTTLKAGDLSMGCSL